jgi:hypothetical protein
MRLFAIVVLALCLTLPGLAGANPVIGNWLYIDFDPPGYVHSVYPEPYTYVDAYVMFGHPEFPENGLTCASFALQLTPGMASGVSFAGLLPGNLWTGSWDTGITVCATECVGLNEGPVEIGVLSLYYLGQPGDVAIIDHPEYPRWVVDCNDPGQVVSYCVYTHGGIGKNNVVGDCGVNPVEDVSWAAVKALYR